MPGTLSAESSRIHYSVLDYNITLYSTDGDSSIRPNAERNRVVQEDGSVDYMYECTRDDPALVLWKAKVGTFLAEVVFKLPEAKGRRTYMLKSLPRGYALFIHKKGDRHNPRHDAYLWGAKGIVFRSPAEFFFHAKWIALGCPQPDPSKSLHLEEELFGPAPADELDDRCGCKYCARTDQAYISKKYSRYCPSKKPVNREGARRNRGEARDYGNITARFEGTYS